MEKAKREVAVWTRWLHIYLSMVSFATLLFFAATGITLNHTEWIEGQQVVEQVSGELETKWLGTVVDELKIVEALRNNHQIRSPLSAFTTDETECSVSFKGPGYTADGFIDRETGSYELTITRSGWVAVMNDLHKGRDSGTTWSLFIDISAVLMIIVSLTGFLMIFFLKKKRVSGLLLAILGGLAMVVLYWVFV
ncbi:MAG: PepSY-associated TM helix domain-containing protein [Bacteroidota bacterium]